MTTPKRPALKTKADMLRYIEILERRLAIAEAGAATQEQPLSLGANAKPLRILVAEDNQTNRQIIQQMLTRLGHTVEVVINGFEALKVLEQRPFDIFFVDVQMPEMDGLETTRVIRRRVARVLNPQMRIVAVTAFTHPETRIKCKESGMDDFLPKPISMETLRSIIQRVCHPTTAEEPSRSGDAPAGNTGGSTIFDRNGFLARLNGNEEALIEILQVFMKSAPEKIRALKDFLTNRAQEPLALQAHSLSGAAANIGAERLRRLAKDLEQAAETGDFPEAEKIVTLISDEFALLQSAIRES